MSVLAQLPSVEIGHVQGGMAIDHSCLLDQSPQSKSHPCLHFLFAKIKHQPQMTLARLSQRGHRPEERLAWEGEVVQLRTVITMKVNL